MIARLVWSITAVAIFLCFARTEPQAQEKVLAKPMSAEFSTILMQSTFLVQGPKLQGLSGQYSFGTSFLMGRPTPDDSKKVYYVLVTAAHVFEAIGGDIATLALRQGAADGSYKARPWPIKLRDNGTPLYVKPNDADVAALYVNMPDDLNVVILPTDFLADDDVLEKIEIHPGDELLCLGFPLLISSESGFPILRSGKIASYPIVPTTINKHIYFDFRVFEGNSGGPAYFVDRNRVYGGAAHLGETINFVVGLVTSQLGSRAYNDQFVELASVVPARYIREAIDLLPPTSPYK